MRSLGKELLSTLFLKFFEYLEATCFFNFVKVWEERRRGDRDTNDGGYPAGVRMTNIASLAELFALLHQDSPTKQVKESPLSPRRRANLGFNPRLRSHPFFFWAPTQFKKKSVRLR